MAHGKLAAVSVALMSSACLYDGAFLVRGRLEDPRTSAPIPGASVRIGRDRSEHGAATTRADGSFEIVFGYGGMAPFTFGRPTPTVELAAAGYRTRTARLKSAAVEAAGDARTRCAPYPGCYLLEATLDPEDSSAAAP